MLKSEKLNVFFVGKAFTGSTILGSYLNKHPKICYIGELDRLPGNNDGHGLYYGPEVCMQCAIKNENCKLFSKKNIAHINNKNPIQSMEYLRKRVKKPILVDGSKNVDWLKSALFNQDQEKVDTSRVIILVKNPVSYLKSCQDRQIEPLWEQANSWRDLYIDAIRTVNQLGVANLLVRVEDFEKNPEVVIRRISNFLNVKYKKDLVNSTDDLHAIGGNGRAYINSFDKGTLKELFEKNDMRHFGINPSKVKNKKLLFKKNSVNADLSEIAFMTPGLMDLASQLGYNFRDFKN